MFKSLLMVFAFLFPFATQAAGVDLEIRVDDIRFSKALLVAGDHVRLYAKIYNVGTEDVAGYVSFFQGSVPIGNSQVVSSVAGGAPDEVYVDFIVPASTFNVRAIIQGTDPVDQQLDNNVAITPVFTPSVDDDHDGIENKSDNCPQEANANQLDTDSDMRGDACDEDDDNDGLSDAVEIELGTNPLSKDSDQDGVLDPNDAYPTDARKSSLEEVKKIPVPVSKPELQPVVISIPEPTVSVEPELVPEKTTSKITSILNKVVEQVTGIEDPSIAPMTVVTSTNAVFTYERTGWNRFVFRVLGSLREGDVYEWDLGDGTSSSRTIVEHTYQSSGTFSVRLTVHTPSQESSTESVEIEVPLFSLNNPLIIGMIVVLGVTFLSALLGMVLLQKKAQQLMSDSEQDEEAIWGDDDDDGEFDVMDDHDLPSEDDSQETGKRKIFVKEE